MYCSGRRSERVSIFLFIISAWVCTFTSPDWLSAASLLANTCPFDSFKSMTRSPHLVCSPFQRRHFSFLLDANIFSGIFYLSKMAGFPLSLDRIVFGLFFRFAALVIGPRFQCWGERNITLMNDSTKPRYAKGISIRFNGANCLVPFGDECIKRIRNYATKGAYPTHKKARRASLFLARWKYKNQFE